MTIPLMRILRIIPFFLALIVFYPPITIANDQHRSKSSENAAGTGPESENQTSPESPAPDAPLLDPDSKLYQTVKYAGKYHVMMIHLPIAFLLGAMVVQWYRVAKGRGGSVVATMLWFGATSALGAAALGWMYAYDSVYFGEDEKLLFWHRWLGTGTAALALIVLSTYRKLGPKSLAIGLTVCAALVAATGHLGASLVYGPEFLLKY